MATVALSGIITPTNVVTATSTTTLTNKTLTGAVMNGTLGATTPSTVVATTVKASTTMGVGGATPSASGAGITFPADQSILGASSDANTLDDYEEGTFTPTFTTAGGSITFNNRYGTYVKIGKLVTVTVFFSITSVSSPTGRFIVTNLPFTAASGTTYSSAGGVSPYTMAAGAYMIALEIDPGSTSAIYFNFANGVRYECSPYFQASTQIVSTLTYQV